MLQINFRSDHYYFRVFRIEKQIRSFFFLGRSYCSTILFRDLLTFRSRPSILLCLPSNTSVIFMVKLLWQSFLCPIPIENCMPWIKFCGLAGIIWVIFYLHGKAKKCSKTELWTFFCFFSKISVAFRSRPSILLCLPSNASVIFTVKLLWQTLWQPEGNKWLGCHYKTKSWTPGLFANCWLILVFLSKIIVAFRSRPSILHCLPSNASVIFTVKLLWQTLWHPSQLFLLTVTAFVIGASTWRLNMHSKEGKVGVDLLSYFAFLRTQV